LLKSLYPSVGTEPGAVADRRPLKVKTTPWPVGEVQSPNQALLQTSPSLKVKTTPGLAGEGAGPEPGAAADRRPLEGGDDPCAGPEPGAAADRHPLEGEDDPLVARAKVQGPEPGAAEVRRPLKVKLLSP
jgi:hypothetical protein